MNTMVLITRSDKDALDAQQVALNAERTVAIKRRKTRRQY